MSDEPDFTQRPGWKAVERWLKDNEPPPRKTPVHEPMAKWGTRGVITGCVIGFLIVAVGSLMDRHLSLKGLLAFPMLMGILAIPCGFAGMLVGLAIWLFRRS